MKRQKITILSTNKDEPSAEIPAFVDGAIAVHRCYLGDGMFAKHYSVTHIPTGRSFCMYLTYGQARLFATVLLENRDIWNFDETSFAAMKAKTRKAKGLRKPLLERMNAARAAIGVHV